ncbi:aldo-keto reductase AKR2E4-like [Pararge aegeria]|uniref:aldo-keto reductase AKR2E4-like n=1 Tax=Pararge aegeria TaxID=116150 RepID=UPI0019D2F68F|nr:aldo-keto reductase AKR2E4-like [Pararge aegeria]
MLQYNDRVPIRQGTIDAIEAGCRHIDTAFAYLTEDMVGEAIVDVIKRGIVKREDIYVTTKLSFEVSNRKLVVPTMKKALKRLQLKYVDLVLIHTPVNVLGQKSYDYLEIWKGLEDAKRMGLTRSIGVSNFNRTQLDEILANSKTMPAVHQIEVNPTFVNQELVAYSQSKNITVAGYSSFGFLVKRVFNDLSVPPTFEDPKLVRMAKKHGVTVSQIVQRYLAGYRCIDTAFGYLTEDMVGEAMADVIRRGIVKRTDIFVNTKLSFQYGTCSEVVPAVKKSLKRMKIDYVDLILIHTPRNVMGVENYDTFEIWKGLEEAKRLGLTRSIGVSNFNSTDMARILANSKTLPAVNQIETNPTFANQELVAYCQSKSIVVMGYSSFGFLVPRPFNDLSLPPSFEDPTLVGMAEKYGVTVSQVVQRYLYSKSEILS